MKKTVINKISGNDEIRPEYDFSSMKGALLGKYSKAYRAGHKVVVHNEDGAISVQYFKLEDGAVLQTGSAKGVPLS